MMDFLECWRERTKTAAKVGRAIGLMKQVVARWLEPCYDENFSRKPGTLSGLGSPMAFLATAARITILENGSFRT